MVCGILAAQEGIKPITPALEGEALLADCQEIHIGIFKAPLSTASVLSGFKPRFLELTVVHSGTSGLHLSPSLPGQTSPSLALRDLNYYLPQNEGLQSGGG